MTCSHIPAISYTEWCRRVYDKSQNTRTPLNGVLELTYGCSLKCAHCYIVDYPVKKELTCRETCLIIDQLAESGCFFLLLTGGEPLIRGDFKEIYLYAKRKGMLVTLFTNGTLLTPEIADLLAKYPPFTVEITLYGVTEETNVLVTGVPGALKKCLRGIELLVERKIPLKLKSMIMSLNKHELPLMKDFAKKLGVDFRFDTCINPRLDGSQKPCSLRITPDEIIELDAADEKRAKEWREVCENYWGTPAIDDRYGCAAGVTFFAIDPAGGLKICSLVEPVCTIQPDSAESFMQAWNNLPSGILSEKRSADSICNHCRIFSICDRCAANSRLETGKPDNPVRFFCKVAGLRAKTFGSTEQVEKLKIEGGFPYDETSKKDLSETLSYKSGSDN